MYKITFLALGGNEMSGHGAKHWVAAASLNGTFFRLEISKSFCRGGFFVVWQPSIASVARGLACKCRLKIEMLTREDINFELPYTTGGDGDMRHELVPISPEEQEEFWRQFDAYLQT